MADTSFLDLLEDLADASAAAIMPHFASPQTEVETKADHSPVTIADRNAEQVLRSLIETRYPEHGIVGEEFGTLRADAEYVWYLDPIDGTKSFVRGCPLFGTLIGLTYRGKPLLGCINHPALGLRVIGNGTRTTCNGIEVHVNDHAPLGDAALVTSDYGMVGHYQDLASFEELVGKVQLFRTWGDCYGYTLLVRGFVEIACDPIMNSWDLVPIIPVVEGAGGRITSWDGSSAVGADSCVAAASILHAQVIQLLNGPR